MRVMTAAAVLGLAGTSLAGDLEFRGDTTDGSRFNRPFSLTLLSSFADDVPYEATQIGVSSDGAYDVLSDQTSLGSRWDGFLLVYQGAFEPSFPLENLIALNDDYFGPGLPGTGEGYSGLRNVTMFESTSYFIVQTGVLNGSEGPYQMRLSGPGDIFIIPAPGSLALLGLGGLAAARRRR